MGLIVAAIVFLISACNAAAGGDYSGLQIIEKIVLFIACYIILGLMLLHPVLLVIVLAIVLIVCNC